MGRSLQNEVNNTMANTESDVIANTKDQSAMKTFEQNVKNATRNADNIGTVDPGKVPKSSGINEHAYKENVQFAPFKETRNTRNKELRIFGMETYITTGTILFSRKHTVLLDQLKYFPMGDHDDGPDALEMALREAEIKQVGFVMLDDEDIRDKHGRGIGHPDFGQTTPEDDARDEDDDDDEGRLINLS